MKTKRVIHLNDENVYEQNKSLFSISAPAPTGEHCIVCGDELMKYIICGNERYSPCSCVKIKLQQEREIEIERQIERKKHRSNIPREFEGSTFDNFEVRKGTEIAFKSCKAYAEKYKTYADQGMGFILVGNTGSGKSRLACTIGNELLKMNKSVVYFNISELYDDVNSNYGQLPEEIYKSGMIILDDFGVDKTSNAKETALYKILDYRIRNLLSTILTTNVKENDWELYLEARALSRLNDNRKFKKILLSAADYRRSNK